MVGKRPSSRPIQRKSISTDVAKRKAKRKEDRRAKKRRVVKATTTTTTPTSADDDNDEYKNDKPQHEGGMTKKTKNKSHKKKTIDSTSSGSSSKKKRGGNTNTDFYNTIDPSIAAALRNDDEEIARLEQDLGLTSGSKQKKKLHKEYAKLEGYGDDFGDFLDGIDGMLGRIENGDGDGEQQQQGDVDSMDESDYDSDECEELIPMKDPAGVDEYDIQVSSDNSEEDDDDENDDDDNSSSNDNDDDTSDNSAQSNSDDDDDDEEEDNPKRRTIRDHNIKDTYVPSVGQDLYGNTIAHDGDDEGSQPKKYIPPHLRNTNAAPDSSSNSNTTSDKQTQHKHHQDQHALDTDNEDRANTLRTLQRLLNNNLNRLSDNTLESVTQSITSLYSSSNKQQQQQQYSTQDINHYFWKNIRAACVASHVVLSGLIPVYLACAAGVHYQTSGSGGGGGSVGFGAYLLECVVLDLWENWKTRREEARSDSTTTEGMTPARQDTGRQEDDDGDAILHGNKEGSNLILLLCYLYNYGVIHCTIMYDVVRHLIEHFTEGDIELLLIILSHCGHQLRSDDPSALKDIVLSVKDRSLLGVGNTENGSPSSSSSRALHMIDAITDLKNNRKRKNDTAIREKTLGYRKVIGRMKSIVTLRSKGDRVVDSNGLRITLKDILDIGEKGRWWKVGASWTGTQFRKSDSGNGENEKTTNNGSESVVDSEQQIQRSSSSSNNKANDKQHQKLLKLATKQRMNTPTRRTIFCIIMSSDDCQDAFQKLLAAKLFQGGGGGGSDTSSERDVVRVIVHCCGSEKVYNPYYSHLATRVCELRSGCRFTFQLTFWDAFKQFGGGSGSSKSGGMRARKAANLAKMLAHLLIAGRLGLNVLKPIDISPDGGMPEAAIVFLTILFSTIFEELDDSSQVSNIFKKVGSSGANGGGGSETNIEDDEDDNVLAVVDEREALKESISVFLLHFMEEHPNNIKRSQFRKNFKVAVKACDTDGLDFMM